MAKQKILCLGDLHLPYCSKQAVTKALALIDEIQPNVVIQMGDLYDLYSYSKFPRNVNINTPSDELLQGRAGAEEIWAAVNNRVKKAIKFQLKGNHDDRAYKRMLEKAPDLAPFCDFESLWKFKGVHTYQDSRTPLEIDGTLFIHGHKTKWLDHVKKYRQSIVYGHTHRGGCLNWKDGEGPQMFELNCGYLGNPHHEALLYREMKKFDDWTHGVGLIDKHGGRFIAI